MSLGARACVEHTRRVSMAASLVLSHDDDDSHVANQLVSVRSSVCPSPTGWPDMIKSASLVLLASQLAKFVAMNTRRLSLG